MDWGQGAVQKKNREVLESSAGPSKPAAFKKFVEIRDQKKSVGCKTLITHVF